MSAPLVITVVGLPAPQGSKRHVGNGIMVESSKRVKPWRQDVKYAALEALRTGPQDDQGMAERIGSYFERGTPVTLDIVFGLPRTKGHYGTGRNAHLLKGSAPRLPASKPDLDKCLRSTMDALGEAGVWWDDAQVTSVRVAKRYVYGAEHPGAHIVVAVDTAAVVTSNRAEVTT